MKQAVQPISPMDCALVEVAPAGSLARAQWDAAQFTIDECLHRICRALAESDTGPVDPSAIRSRLRQACLLTLRRFGDEEELLAAGAHPMLPKHSKQHQAIVNGFKGVLTSLSQEARLDKRFDAVHRLRVQVIRHFEWDDSIYRQLIWVKA